MKNSPYSEDELLEIAAKFKRHLKDHFNDLNNVCPELDQEFIFKFKALFYEVQAHPLEPEVNKTTQDFKLNLEDIGNQVRGLFPIFRFYLQKAFPYDSSLWEAYEYCQIENAVHDYSTLYICLKESVKIIEEKKLELRAANCPEPTLREIESLSKQVNDKYEELLEYQKVMDLKKKVYHNNMSELFKSMKMVDEVASKCYQNNPELLIKLTFPPKHQVPQK